MKPNVKLSYSRLKCPRCSDPLSIVFDECDIKNNIYTGYCYNPIHKRLKVKLINKMRMSNKLKSSEEYSMSGLRCIFCGNENPWFQSGRSYPEGNRILNECQNCKIGIEHLGKLVKNCITFDEILRIRLKRYKYN